MKKITLLAAFVTIVSALAGPATVLAADPAGSEPQSPEAIASIYVVDLVATAAFGAARRHRKLVSRSGLWVFVFAPPRGSCVEGWRENRSA